MNQYAERKVPALLRKNLEQSSVKGLNSDLVEVVINGQRLVVPTAEAYNRLVAKVARLEQRIINTDNKSTRALRKSSE